MVRESGAHVTEHGQRTKAIVDSREFIPDDVVKAMIEHRIGEPDCVHGFVLDGFPRSIARAKALAARRRRMGWLEPVATNLRVDESLILRRLTERRICKVDGPIYNIYDHSPKMPDRCAHDRGEMIQGTDEGEQAIREGLLAFHQVTQPAIKYNCGRDLLAEVDGVGTPEHIARGIIAVIEREENRGRQL